MKTTNILEEVTNLVGGLKDGQTDHQLQGATMVGAELTNHPVETGELQPPQFTGGESNQDGQGATNPTTTNPSRMVRSVNQCSIDQNLIDNRSIPETVKPGNDVIEVPKILYVQDQAI